MIPSLVALVAIAGFFVFLAHVLGVRPEATSERFPEIAIESSPHGRVLRVVIEKAGAYVGERFVRSDDVSDFIAEEYRDASIDHVTVVGTQGARFGDVVKAYAAISATVQVSVSLQIEAVADGTRMEPVEIHKSPWWFRMGRTSRYRQPGCRQMDSESPLGLSRTQPGV